MDKEVCLFNMGKIQAEKNILLVKVDRQLWLQKTGFYGHLKSGVTVHEFVLPQPLKGVSLQGSEPFWSKKNLATSLHPS